MLFIFSNHTHFGDPRQPQILKHRGTESAESKLPLRFLRSSVFQKIIGVFGNTEDREHKEIITSIPVDDPMNPINQFLLMEIN